MISLDVKSDSKTSSPIGLSLPNSKEESKLSFSDLLKGASSKDAKNGKTIQNGAFVLALDEDTKSLKTIPTAIEGNTLSKKESLATLLKGSEITLKSEVPLKSESNALVLNPEVSKNLSTIELKQLISDAKQFLKDKIVESDGFKKVEIKELPKTLKGLAQMAKTFGIELSKISVEEVRVGEKNIQSIKESIKVDAQTPKEAQQANTVKATETNIPKQVDTIKVDESQSSKKADLKVENVVDTKDKVQKSINVKSKKEQEIVQDVNTKDNMRENLKVDEKKAEIIRDTKFTPLFKVQEKVVVSTAQIIQSKQLKVEEKVTSKTKADETLKLLLRGEKPSLELGNMTKDFSVATARVIAPGVATEANKSLEQLLRGGTEEASQKLDGLSTNKADSFEVKLNESKQMIKYLSQDVKTAIEDYKAPFTRVKVQLNPQKLGEVDVTIVQRGKNLHVNISSNTAAINTLAMNANELKTQLNINGINNASLNFNNNSQNSEQQNAQQQQSRENERRADQEYNYFDQEEQNEEILSSLEIVVPNYA